MIKCIENCTWTSGSRCGPLLYILRLSTNFQWSYYLNYASQNLTVNWQCRFNSQISYKWQVLPTELRRNTTCSHFLQKRTCMYIRRIALRSEKPSKRVSGCILKARAKYERSCIYYFVVVVWCIINTLRFSSWNASPHLLWLKCDSTYKYEACI